MPHRIAMLEGYQVGSLGEALPPDAAREFEVAAANVLADLRSAIKWLSIKIAAYRAYRIVPEGVGGAIPTWNAILDAKEKRMFEVINGTTSPVKWLSSMEIVRAGIAENARAIGEENYFAYASQTFNAAATKFVRIMEKVGAGLEKTAEHADLFFPLLAVGVGVIVLWHVNSAMGLISFPARAAKKLNGYSGRKGSRRKRR